MKRMTLVKLHLYFAGLILVFLAFTALSGSLHLFLGDETEQVKEVKTFNVSSSIQKEELTNIFEKELNSINSNYRFDYIKGSSSSQTSRPTSRTYYTINLKDGVASIKEHQPSILMSLMELHKGHGPLASRNVLGILGVIAILTVLTGFGLGISSRAFRKVTIATVFSGAFVYLLLFFL
jgi:hypothetical protein